MIKIINIIFVSLGLFVIAGCTINYEFKIANLTNHSISIEYTFHDISKLGAIFNLNLIKAKMHNYQGKNQLPVYKKFNYNIDSTSFTVKSLLQRNEILEVGIVNASHDLSKIEERKKLFTHLKCIKIISKDDTLSATTKFIHTLFIPTSDEYEYLCLLK